MRSMRRCRGCCTDLGIHVRLRWPDGGVAANAMASGFHGRGLRDTPATWSESVPCLRLRRIAYHEPLSGAAGRWPVSPRSRRASPRGLSGGGPHLRGTHRMRYLRAPHAVQRPEAPQRRREDPGAGDSRGQRNPALGVTAPSRALPAAPVRLGGYGRMPRPRRWDDMAGTSTPYDLTPAPVLW